MSSVEECSICYDPLGESLATHLPCGHVFCSECVHRWAKEAQGCPQCRTPYRPQKLRALASWTGGLALKAMSKEESDATQALESVKAARSVMEQRAKAAERALRQEEKIYWKQPLDTRTIAATITPGMGPGAAAPSRPPTAESAPQAPTAPVRTSELTMEQQARIRANREAALRIKRERDAAVQT